MTMKSIFNDDGTTYMALVIIELFAIVSLRHWLYSFGILGTSIAITMTTLALGMIAFKCK